MNWRMPPNWRPFWISKVISSIHHFSMGMQNTIDSDTEWFCCFVVNFTCFVFVCIALTRKITFSTFHLCHAVIIPTIRGSQWAADTIFHWLISLLALLFTFTAFGQHCASKNMFFSLYLSIFTTISSILNMYTLIWTFVFDFAYAYNFFFFMYFIVAARIFINQLNGP